MSHDIDGVVSTGFEPVLEAFARLFDDPDELGAAFCAFVDGRPVADVWGGTADRATGRPWTRDTPVVIFSGTKGVTAICLLLLWDRGLLKDATRVSEIWPEFAAGKEAVTVGHVLSHTAGVPGLRQPYSFDQLIDTEGFATLVAAEPPFWKAGETLAYHAKTFGPIASQIVKRLDGRPIGRFLAEEISTPFALDLWLGLPEDLESRVAVIEVGSAPRPWDILPPVEGDDRILLEAMLYDPPSPPGSVNWNRPDAHRAGVASTGAIATARSVARLYSVFTCHGRLDGVPLLGLSAVRRASRPLRRARPPLEGLEMAFGPGLQLDEPLAPPNAPQIRAVGHTGLGGSLHGYWPDLGASFSFVMNRQLAPGDGRGMSVLAALYSVLAAR